MTDTNRVFVSIFIGGFLGSFISLELLPNYLFWVGSIVGGIVGYLSKDLKEVKEKAPEAWRKASARMKEEKYGWEIIKSLANEAYDFFIAFLATVSFFVTFSYCMFILIGIIYIILLNNSFSFNDIFFVSLASSILMFYLLFSEEEMPDRKESYHLLLYWNPITFTFYQIPKFIVALVKITPKVIKWSFTVAIPVVLGFFVELFFLVYSDEKLLCGIWASVGAVVGFFTGSSLVGASVGALIGVLNYEILSKRVLNLIPEENEQN